MGAGRRGLVAEIEDELVLEVADRFGVFFRYGWAGDLAGDERRSWVAASFLENVVLWELRLVGDFEVFDLAALVAGGGCVVPSAGQIFQDDGVLLVNRCVVLEFREMDPLTGTWRLWEVCPEIHTHSQVVEVDRVPGVLHPVSPAAHEG